MTVETTDRGLTVEQLTMLLTPLNPNRVKEHKGNAHLEAWDVRRWLTRIFGFGGWSDEILSMECIHSVTSPIGNDPNPLKHRCTAVYRVTLRLTIKDQWGNELGHWDDGATGEGVNQVSVGDAHDLALKAALSQALKRCAVNLCDQFGLSLYNKGDVRGVVVRTLGHPGLTTPGAVPEDAPVVGGELDEQREPVDAPQEAPKRERQSKVQRERPSAPPPDEWAGDAPSEPVDVPSASMAQLNALNTLISKKYGPLPREKRLGAVAKLAGRPLLSSKDLTKREASNVIDALNAMPDFVLTEEAVVAAAEELAAVAEPPEVAEEERLRDRVESAGDSVELEHVMQGVFDAEAAGTISGEAFGRLQAAGTARLGQLKQLAANGAVA